MGIQSDIRDHLLSQPASFRKKREYQIEELLGRGGFGKVLKAKWTPAGGETREVALKIINKALVKDNDTVKEEINVLEGLDHPNIVRVWDHFESRDKYYIAFELAVGGELFDRISNVGRFTEKDAMSVIHQVLSATAYIHAHRIVHRDLKPENIIYKTKADDSQVVIADFGIAKHLSGEEGEEEDMFDAAGSFGYAAPEVLLGKGHGTKVDLWSIGIIAYTLLCGYAPFRAESKEELIRESMRGKVQFHERYWRKVSETAKEFVKALIQVDPKKRLSAEEALRHPWLMSCTPTEHDLAPAIKEHFTAKKRWNKAFIAISAANRLRSGSNPKSTTTSPKSPGISPSNSISPTSIPPSTPHSATLLNVPTTPPDPSPGSLTPLSMSEDEEVEGFVTADEPDDELIRVISKKSNSGEDRDGIGGDVPSEAVLNEARKGSVTPKSNAGSPARGISTGKEEKMGGGGIAGLKGMMGRLGLGRISP